MNILKSVEVQNFRCFRGKERAGLGEVSYFIGPNNAGKSAFLKALRCFFDSSCFRASDLNKAVLSRRQKGYTQSKIAVEFDLHKVTNKALSARLAKMYGDSLKVTKVFSYGEQSKQISESYELPKSKKKHKLADLPKDVLDLINACSISYIHPQQGAELLEQAREKFKARLFHNWGRHSSISSQLKDAQTQWENLRKTANIYLSSALTSALQKVWPSGSAHVELPDQIKDIVAISDISFKSSPSHPEISLTSQGTGAQSLILYQTHFLLDSDRSLHLGQYYPIWLLEEPEAFLHADIEIKLGELLASSDWLATIQMIVSTHSPLILAAAPETKNVATWTILEDHAVKEELLASKITEQHVNDVGKMMGDANFDVYFFGSETRPMLFLEDGKSETRDAFERSGISVTRGLNGVADVKKYLAVFKTLPGMIKSSAHFLVDKDEGWKEIKGIIENATKEEEIDGFERYAISEKLYVIALPGNFAVEDLFSEFDDFVDDCYSDIYDENHAFQKQAPVPLSHAVNALRKQNPPNKTAAFKILRKNEDVKNKFWQKVRSDSLSLSARATQSIKDLLKT